MPRIFVDKALQIGQNIELPSAAARHVVKVLRLGVGQQITVFNGRGGEYEAEVCELGRRVTRVTITEFHATERESPLTITLVQGISRGERMDFTIQKAVELGVDTIIPFQAHRSTSKLSTERASRRLRHWQGVIYHACEQSGRNRIPTLTPITDLEQIATDTDGELKLVMSPLGERQLSEIPLGTGAIRLVVGPEGGLDDHEQERLRSAGYEEFRVGPRVLRTETAAIAGITLLQARFGDLGD